VDVWKTLFQKMPNAKYLISILVVAQVLAHGVMTLADEVIRELLTPLLWLLGGVPELRFGPINFSGLFREMFSSVVFVVVSLLVLKLVLRVGWISAVVPSAKSEAGTRLELGNEE